MLQRIFPRSRRSAKSGETLAEVDRDNCHSETLPAGTIRKNLDDEAVLTQEPAIFARKEAKAIRRGAHAGNWVPAHVVLRL